MTDRPPLPNHDVPAADDAADRVEVDTDDVVGERSGARRPHASGSWWPLLPVALLTYVPFLLTRPGVISADTKTYLYLDPGRLMSRAWSIWDPNVGMGTVSHQTIGYLWPMGPWYWFFDRLGVPDWVAQRLWWGTLLFAATSGAAYLLRRFEVPAIALWPAALVFGLSPYSVAYLGRLSGVLLPAIGLPWLLAFTIQSVRNRGWRHPALFALTTATVGSVNLTALVLVGVAPLLWLVYVLVTRQEAWRDVVRATAKIGVLTLATSAWWLAGLTVQATHGIDIVRYSESAEVVARTALALEVLRGLGYWFFYGGDKLELWIEPSYQYARRRIVLAGSFVLPWLAFASGIVSRWRHRAFFVMVLVVGVLLSVGAHPWYDPSGFGGAVKWFLSTERGLAFRSLPRSVPLIALASAALIGGLIAGLAATRPAVARVLAVGVVFASIFGMVPLWQRSIVQDSLARQEVPDYWIEAARVLDERDDGTRVLEVPGSDFASYRWGNTVDPITPGLMDRPYVARELVPYGTPPSADLLNDFDLLLQERTLSSDAIAPIARLMRVGDIVVRNDLQYERYNLARPRLVWDQFRDVPGLGEPIELTGPVPNHPTSRLQMQDETWLIDELGLPDPPAVAVVPVEGSRPVIDVKGAEGAVLVSGDGAGLVDAAAAGRIDGSELIRYSGSLDAAQIDAELGRGASLLVTDSNRKRGERWGSLRHTRGQTERVDEEELVENVTDNRLPRFEDRGSDVQTVTVQRGQVVASATSYGNPITFAADNRPALAIDGDPDTHWATAAFSDARGERLVLSLDEPIDLDHVILQQVHPDRSPRRITRVRIDVGDGRPVEVDLTGRSRIAPGQRVELGPRRTDEVTITVLADSLGDLERYGNAGPVGFAEVVLGDEAPRAVEIVRVPTDLVDAVEASGDRADDARLTYLFTRLRQDPADRTRDDEERGMDRRFRVPSDRRFTLVGTARISARADDPVLDDLLGTTGAQVSVVDSTKRMSGSRVVRASAALDGDPSTAWTSPFADVIGQSITVTTTEPRTFDRLDLQVVADLAHSIPTRLRVSVDGTTIAEPIVPPLERGPLGTARRVPIDLPATVGSRLRVEVLAIDRVESVDWTSNDPVDHPVAFAELGIPGLSVEPTSTLDDRCRDDLVTLDGEPLPIRITGSTDDALRGAPLRVEPCDGAAIALEQGDVDLHVAAGVATGIDIDQLVLESAGTSPTAAAPSATGARVVVVDEAPDRNRIELTGLTPGEPVWLILGQSLSDGWSATADGEDLGAPQLVDGFANGWLITPEATSMGVDVRFTPQRRVTVGIVVSLAAAALALVLAIRRPRGARGADLAHGSTAPVAGAPLGLRSAVGLGLVTAAVVAWFTAPATGLVLGVVAAVGAATRLGRQVLRVLPAVVLAGAVAYALALALTEDLPPGIEWVTDLDPAHPFAMAAVAALAVDLVVDRAWRRRISPSRRPRSG